MPFYDGTVDLDPDGTGNEALIAQQLRLKRRQKQLEAEAANLPTAPQGQMVSGRYVAPAVTQQLLPIFAKAVNQAQLAANDKENTDIDRRLATAAVQHMSNPPPSDATPQQKIMWAQQGAQIPGLKPMMDMYLQNELVNEPARQEKRADAKDAQAEKFAEAQRKQQADIDYRKQHDADLIQRGREHDETLRAMKSMGGGSGGGSYQYMGETDDGKNSQFYNPKTGQVSLGPPKPEKPAKPLPSNQATSWVNNNKSIAQIDSTLSMLDTPSGKEATGFKGYLPNAVLQRADPNGVDARAAVANIGSLKIHDRSGAAVTVSETPRLLPFIPLTTDDNATVKKKLRGLKNELLQSQQSIQDFADSQGYKAPVSSTTPAPGDNSVPVPGSSILRMPAESKGRMKFNPATGQLE